MQDLAGTGPYTPTESHLRIRQREYPVFSERLEEALKAFGCLINLATSKRELRDIQDRERAGGTI